MAISCNNRQHGGNAVFQLATGWRYDPSLSALSHPFTLHALHLYATLPVSILLGNFNWVDNCSFGIHARAHVNRETVLLLPPPSVDLKLPIAANSLKIQEDRVLDLQTKHTAKWRVKCKFWEVMPREKKKYFKCHVKIKFKVYNVFQFQS